MSVLEKQIQNQLSDVLQMQQVSKNMEKALRSLGATAQEQFIQNKQNEQTIISLNHEVKSLKQQIDENQKEMRRLFEQIQLAEQEIKNQKINMNQMDSNYSHQLQQKDDEQNKLLQQVVMISAENDRLVDILFNKANLLQKQRNELREHFEILRNETKQNLEIVKEQYYSDKKYMDQIVIKQKQENDQLIKESSKLEQRIYQYEMQLNQSTNEKKQLMDQLQHKVTEVERVRGQMLDQKNDFEQALHDLNERLEYDKNLELEKLERQFLNEQGNQKKNYEERIMMDQSRIEDLENKENYLNKEVDRQNDLLREASSEVMIWKNKLLEAEDIFAKEREEILFEFEEYKKNYQFYQDLEMRFEAERSSYEAQLKQLKQKLSMAESQTNNLKIENNKLSLQSVERMKQIEIYKQKAQSNLISPELEEVRKQLDAFQKQNNSCREQILRLQSEKNQIMFQRDSMKGDMRNKENELSQAYDLIHTLQNQTSGNSRLVDDSRLELKQLKQQINQLEADNLMLQENQETYQRENEELKTTVLSLRQLIASNEEETVLTIRELKNKIKDVDQIKGKYQQEQNQSFTLSRLKQSFTGVQQQQTPIYQQNFSQKDLGKATNHSSDHSRKGSQQDYQKIHQSENN